MPGINEYKCNICGFSMPIGSGGYMYVEDNEGKRIPCPHPGEEFTVAQVLGEDKDNLSLWEKRVGFNSICLCLKCHHWFDADLRDEVSNYERITYYNCPSEKVLLDGIKKLLSIKEMCIPGDVWKQIFKEWEKDERKCPSCGSDDVKTESELAGGPCPICAEGVIDVISLGIS